MNQYLVLAENCGKNEKIVAKELLGTAMFWHKIKARRFVLCVLGEFSAGNTLVRVDIRLLLQQKIPETYTKLRQFAGRGQNCEFVAKGKNCGPQDHDFLQGLSINRYIQSIVYWRPCAN